MQVSLNPIDWKKLTSFGTAENFMEYLASEQETGEDEDSWHISSLSLGIWPSDSASQYFQVASNIDHLADAAPEPMKSLVIRGLQPLISVSSQVDEFGTGPASEDHTWISASPETTRDIHDAMLHLDLGELKDFLANNPPPDPGDAIPDLDRDLISLILQHKAVVAAAVERGYGLMGGCG